MKKINLIINVALSALICLTIVKNAESQNREKLGIISMDTKGLNVDNATMTSLVHLELEKADKYEVLCRYDVSDFVKEKGLDVNECFGKSCLVNIGSMLGADKMLSGSAEKFGNKIVFVFRLIDVNTSMIEKTNVMEYLDQQDQIQTMVRISLNNIIDIENDKHILDLLVHYDLPVTTTRTTLNLNGPRVGFSAAFGHARERMTASKSAGGFNMYPVNSMIGYQYERRFLSAGNFQALFEILPVISGLESGMIVPSLTTMLGFRFNESGLEFGLGPVFRVNKMAMGYYDKNGIWRLRSEVPYDRRSGLSFVERLDSRGSYKFSTGMIFAFGKTFRSGHLNMPVNVYFSPRHSGSIAGIMVGFNVANSPLVNRQKSK